MSSARSRPLTVLGPHARFPPSLIGKKPGPGVQMESSSPFDKLPGELLRLIFSYARNFAVQRLVCAKWNAFSSVLLLQQVVQTTKDGITNRLE